MTLKKQKEARLAPYPLGSWLYFELLSKFCHPFLVI
jgi:hypothetical protein